MNKLYNKLNACSKVFKDIYPKVTHTDLGDDIYRVRVVLEQRYICDVEFPICAEIYYTGNIYKTMWDDKVYKMDEINKVFESVNEFVLNYHINKRAN